MLSLLTKHQNALQLVQPFVEYIVTLTGGAAIADVIPHVNYSISILGLHFI